MRDIAIGFLWHMHQPYYKDPITLLAQIIDCTDAGCRDADLMYHCLKDELEVERHPGSGLLSFTMPDKKL